MGCSRRFRPRLVCGLATLAACLAAPPLPAYESDQYSHRLTPLADARPLLNAWMNEGLQAVVDGWEGPPSERRFARQVYAELGGRHWVDRIERRAMKSDEVEKLPQRRHQSIYAGAPVCATRVNFFFGVGYTFRLAGSLVGSDKLGHFISQGFKYYRIYDRSGSEAKVLAHGRVGERWLFGQLTTSVYSNADLVANYEGYLFYRGLFEEDVVAGKPALVAWRDRRPVLTRRFDWADHVNDYWDEALHPSWLSPALQRYMDEALAELCPQYRRRPEAFVPTDEQALARRYAHLPLKPAPHNRLDTVCAEARAAKR